MWNNNINIIIDHDKDYDDFRCFNNHGTFRLSISHKCSQVAFLSSLVVDEKMRFQGIGNKLLQISQEVAKGFGCDTITLEVLHDSWMREWYGGAGFKVVGEGYQENMVLMSKSI